MRSSTKTFVGLASLGVLVATAKFGLPAAAVASTTNATTSTDVAASGSTTQPATTKPTQSTSTSTKSTKSTTTTTKKTTTTTKKTTSTASATSRTSGAVSYKYGTVQLQVVKKSGKITDVNCITCSATGGRQAAFSSLISASISANGSNFGNIGGATFTTSAFKQALDNALGKF